MFEPVLHYIAFSSYFIDVKHTIQVFKLSTGLAYICPFYQQLSQNTAFPTCFIHVELQSACSDLEDIETVIHLPDLARVLGHLLFFPLRHQRLAANSARLGF